MDYEPRILGAGEVTVYASTDAVSLNHRGWIAGPYVSGMEDAPFEVKHATHQEGERLTSGCSAAFANTVLQK